MVHTPIPTGSQRSHVKAGVRQGYESTMSQKDQTSEIEPGQWTAYFFNARSTMIDNQSSAMAMQSKLNPLANSFSPRGYTENNNAINAIDIEPRRSARLKEKREKLTSQAQAPKVSVSIKTSDVNNTELVCSPTSIDPSSEEAEEITSTDRDAGVGDKSAEVINQTQGHDRQTTVENQIADQDDDGISPQLSREIIHDSDVTENDYAGDDEFGDMYKYLRYNQLTGDSETDRRLFRDGTQSWCSGVSPALYEHFVLKRETDRSWKRQRRRR